MAYRNRFATLVFLVSSIENAFSRFALLKRKGTEPTDAAEVKTSFAIEISTPDVIIVIQIGNLIVSFHDAALGIHLVRQAGYVKTRQTGLGQ